MGQKAQAVLGFLTSYWKTLAGIVAAIALILKLDKLVEALRVWVAVGVTTPKGSNQFLLSAIWGWGLAIASIVLFASLTFAIKSCSPTSGQGW